MKALLVIDAQNAILNIKDFEEETANIKQVINDFKENNEPVIFIRNIADDTSGHFTKILKMQRFILLWRNMWIE